MNREALFSDGSEAYLQPLEPAAGDVITFRLRASAKDKLTVILHLTEAPLAMKRVEEKGCFAYYEAQAIAGTDEMIYYFQISDGVETVYYTRSGVTESLDGAAKYRIVPGFSVPDWAIGAVMYQIYTDRFFNGDHENDVLTGEYSYIRGAVSRVEDWDRLPGAFDVRDFYGGDIRGIIEKLDYLQALGVEVIYCNPLFVSPSNHKYDTQDYEYIDPHLGVIVEDHGALLPEGDQDNSHAERYKVRTTSMKNLDASNKLFIRLVEEVHRRGMKIILDGVFNHCGSFNKWMDREKIYEGTPGNAVGAFLSIDSPTRDYFLFGSESWPDNEDYEGWWDFETLPKLNYEGSQELERKILHIGRKWVSPPYNADGWRLDVAADLGHTSDYNHRFWRKFREEVKQANPNAIILAEHYGDPRPWLDGTQWDTVMNYDAFMDPVSFYLTGMEKHSDYFRSDLFGNAEYFAEAMKENMASFMSPSLYTAMNQLSNHDHSRFLTRTNRKCGRMTSLGQQAASEDIDPAVMRMAIIMQMVWVGAPTLYYGDEAGLCGFTDPDNRRTYPWGKEDMSLLTFYQDMIWMHRRYLPLRKGSQIVLYTKGSVVSIARIWKDEKIVAVWNASERLVCVEIPVWRAEIEDDEPMARMVYSYAEGTTREFEEYNVEDGKLTIRLGAYSVAVLKNKRW